MDDIDELKKQRLQQMQKEGAAASGPDMQEMKEQQMRQQLKQIASQILTKEARSRLGNVRAAKPDLASKIELQLVQLHKAGQIRDKITDEQLKQLLKKIQESKDSTEIKY